MTTRRSFLGALASLPFLAPLVGKVEARPERNLLENGDLDAWSKTPEVPWNVPTYETPFLTLLASRPIRKVVNSKFDWIDRVQGADRHRTVEQVNSNFTQLVRTPFGFAGRRKPTKHRLADMKIETEWQLAEHRKSLEYPLFFGKAFEHLRPTGLTYTFSGGLDWFCKNVVEAPALTLVSWFENHPEVMKWGAGGWFAGRAIKYLFLSHDAHKALSAGAGLPAINEFRVRYGRVIVVPTPLLSEFAPKRAYLVDIEHARLAVLRPTTLFDREDDEDTGSVHEYISDQGLELTNPAAHTIFDLV